MSQKSIIFYLLSLIGYVFLQAALLNKLIIANTAFCFFYVGFLLFLPLNTDKLVQLILGFLIGLTIDVFGDTLGIHSISCVFIMFARPYWIKISIGDQVDSNSFINLQEISLPSMLIYSTPLIFIHHSFVFLLDSIGSGTNYNTLLKILFSTFFTFTTLYIIQLFLTPTQKK